jgi:hypothetical protein
MCLTGVGFDMLAWIFTARSIGYLIGSGIIGYFMARYDGAPLLIITFAHYFFLCIRMLNCCNALSHGLSLESVYSTKAFSLFILLCFALL